MTQTIFITGASTGLGRATALLFAERGWNVIATMRKPADGEDLAEHDRITVLPLDVTVPAQIEEAAAKAIAMGGVDVVFNNAGYGLAGPLEGLTDEMLVRQIETNLLGVIRTTKAFAGHLREKQSGVIISTTSIGGHIALPFNSAYHATKWGVEGWSESMGAPGKPGGGGSDERMIVAETSLGAWWSSWLEGPSCPAKADRQPEASLARVSVREDGREA